MGKKQMKDIIFENRKKVKLTQEQLADKLNVSNKTVSKWERGHSYPDILIIPTLVNVLEITINELFDVQDMEIAFIEKHDYNLIGKFKYNVILAVFLLFIPILSFLGTFLESRELFVIFVSLGVFSVLLSIFLILTSSLKFYSFIKITFYSEKYVMTYKNYLGIYLFVIYTLLTLSSLLSSNPIITILIVYLIFCIFCYLLVFKLKLKAKQKINIILPLISSIVLIVGIVIVLMFELQPYYLIIYFAQVINYYLLFYCDKVKSN